MVTMSTFVSASISKNVYLVIVYMCAKFGAFIKSAQFFCLATSLLHLVVKLFWSTILIGELVHTTSKETTNLKKIMPQQTLLLLLEN